MATVTDEPRMAKRNDQPVKIDTHVLAKVRIAAAYKGVSIAEYLSSAIEPIADRDIDEQHAKLRKATEEKPSPKRPK